MRTSFRALLGATLLAAACSSDPPAANNDAAPQDRAEPADVAPDDAAGDANAPDAQADVADDRAPDVAADAAVDDVTGDATGDATSDAAGDVGDDAAPDASPDAADDATADAGLEAGLDAGDVTTADAPEDVAPDASADVGLDVAADLGADATDATPDADAAVLDAPPDAAVLDAPATDVADAAPDAAPDATPDVADASDASADADAAGVDPSFAGVVVLLHMEGAAGGSTFVDVGGHTVRADGAARIGTTARFGSGGAVFDGSGAQLVVAPRARELVFEGAEPFTMEAWVNGTGTIFSCDSYGLLLAIKDARTLYVWVNGVLPWDYTGTAAGTVPEGWHHVALSYDGATYRWFIDGAMTLQQAGRLSSQTNDFLVVGGYGSGVQPWFNGAIDEVRITRGVARYTAPFAPPTAAFPDR